MTDEETRQSLNTICGKRKADRLITTGDWTNLLNTTFTTNAAALAFLYENGVRRVVAQYSGYGDDGSVEYVALWGPECELFRAGFASYSPCNVYYHVVSFVEAHLPGGWNINEGSQGLATITISDGRAELVIDHEENYTSTRETTITDSLDLGSHA